MQVPEQQMSQYAWGYKNDQPIRVSAGMLDAEAYGVKSSSSDMLKFLDIQIHPQKLKQPLRAAVETTHVGYFKVGAMTQGLGWEQYAYAAFIPQQKIGILMLANTNFPNEARITASYHVMQQLLQKNTAQ